jgi:hypothetical protein
VEVSQAGAPIARFDFAGGALRGTHLTLYPSCLVHRGEAQLETMPLAAIAGVRVAFERNARALGWGVALIAAALVLLALSGPLAGLAAGAAGELAPQLNSDAPAAGRGIAGVLHATFRFLQALANLFPTLAAALGLGGVAALIVGWLGATTLTLTVAASERPYAVRGRNETLLDFAEALTERLMLLKR